MELKNSLSLSPEAEIAPNGDKAYGSGERANSSFEIFEMFVMARQSACQGPNLPLIQ